MEDYPELDAPQPKRERPAQGARNSKANKGKNKARKQPAGDKRLLIGGIAGGVVVTAIHAVATAGSVAVGVTRSVRASARGGAAMQIRESSEPRAEANGAARESADLSASDEALSRAQLLMVALDVLRDVTRRSGYGRTV